jgi:hypothetical protein
MQITRRSGLSLLPNHSNGQRTEHNLSYQLTANFNGVAGSNYTDRLICKLRSLYFILLISLFSIGLSFADTDNSKICVIDQNKQQQAINVIRKTTAFKKIQKQVQAGDKVVFGPSQLDKPMLWNNECHWTVTVYVNHSDRLELRSVFLISHTMNRIYQQNTDGDYVILKRPNGVK